MENTIPEVKSESVDRQHDSNEEVVQGNIAPNIAAAPKTEPQVTQAAEATMQPPKEKEPEPVLAFENSGAKLNMEIVTSSTFPSVPEPPKPNQPKPVSQFKPILEPVDPY